MTLNGLTIEQHEKNMRRLRAKRLAAHEAALRAVNNPRKRARRSCRGGWARTAWRRLRAALAGLLGGGIFARGRAALALLAAHKMGLL